MMNKKCSNIERILNTLIIWRISKVTSRSILSQLSKKKKKKAYTVAKSILGWKRFIKHLPLEVKKKTGWYQNVPGLVMFDKNLIYLHSC